MLFGLPSIMDNKCLCILSKKIFSNVYNCVSRKKKKSIWKYTARTQNYISVMKWESANRNKPESVCLEGRMR